MAGRAAGRGARAPRPGGFTLIELLLAIGLMLLLVGAAGFAVARYAGSLAGQIAAAYVGIGFLVALVGWFIWAGLAYFVGAYQQIGFEPGAFIVYAGTHEKAVPEVEKLFGGEINRIVTQGIRKEELERARNQIIADYEMSLQDNLAVAMNSALDELYGLGYQHAFDTRRRFEAVTAAKLRFRSTRRFTAGCRIRSSQMTKRVRPTTASTANQKSSS
jgi:prepilin-type N-terminal cleavage/methylation domain-containing protein